MFLGGRVGGVRAGCSDSYQDRLVFLGQCVLGCERAGEGEVFL